MKKIISIVLCILLLLVTTTSCLASTTTEKPLKSSFEKLNGYEIDKFTKEWSYFQAWDHQYSDAYINIGLQVIGNDEDQMPPVLYCWIRDENNREVIQPVNKILFLIGDDLYTFDNVLEMDTMSSAILGEQAKEFLEALAKANSVTIRLGFKTASIDEEIPSKDYKTTFKAAAKAILDSNIWDYVSDRWKEMAGLYAPTKN